MSNVLDLADQTLFLGERATGATSLLQCIWVYDRDVDLDGVRTFHRLLRRGRLSRRIERSPLPFGRHRWVAPRDEPELVIAAPRPRDAFEAWCREQGGHQPDAERGPGWHLAVLPFTEGGGAVSLVVTHCLTDGVGLCEALADAAGGIEQPVAWPAAARRTRSTALREDARQAASDVPGVGRAVLAAVRQARASRVGAAPVAPARARPAPPVDPDRPIALPMATVFIDADQWDARANALGGTSNALLAGLAAQLAHRVGRVAADGSVTVGMPLNERTPGDTRANAVINVDVVVDPVPAPRDLRPIRAAIKAALIAHNDAPDQRWELLPLVPLIPKWVFRRLISVITGSATTVVSSNLGVIAPQVNRPDGTEADCFAIKSVYPGVTAGTMHCTNGALALLSGRLNGRVFVSALAYELGCHNSNEALREALSSTLSDFSLAATSDWSPPRVSVGG